MNRGRILADLVPHAGAMVLLDEVVSWDTQKVLCRTLSHRRADNPLRRDGQLSSTAVSEYAAQAAAVHGSLNDGVVPGGFLAALKDVRLTIDDLSGIDAPILVEATRLMADPAALLYTFRLYRDTPMAEEIATGRLTVRLLDMEDA